MEEKREILKIYDVHYKISYFKYYTNERFGGFARTKKREQAKVFTDENEKKEVFSNLIHYNQANNYVWEKV